MKKVAIFCPVCKKSGNIEVKENIVSQSKRGVTAVNVAGFLICEHSFVAYIDRNFTLRDSFVSDFTVELPQIQIEDVKKEIIEIPEINIYLLMINVPAITLTYVIRAILYKQNTCIIYDLDIIDKEIDALMKYAFQDWFKSDLIIIPRNSYRKEKKNYKDYIVIDNKEIINDKDKVMDIKDIKIESAIIQKFLDQTDNISSLIIIKSEIQKALVLAEHLADYLNSNDPKVKLTPEVLKEKIVEKFGRKVENLYFKFLLRIAKHYFNTDIANYLDFLDHALWVYFIK